MEIKRSKLFDMTAVIMAGAMSNPASASLMGDQYGQQVLLTNIFTSLTNMLSQNGVLIVDDNKKE